MALALYSLTIASFRIISHINLSSAFFLHQLILIDFRSFSIQPNHLNGIIPFFPFHLLSLGIFTLAFIIFRHSQVVLNFFLYCRYNVWFSIHNLQFITVQFLQPFCLPLIEPHTAPFLIFSPAMKNTTEW